MSHFDEMRAFVGEIATPRVVEAELSARTGVPSLDRALGGALPSGATEIFGEASVGKTSLLYEIIATAQTDGMVVALCASEFLDLPRMRDHCINLNELPIITGNYGEDVYETALRFIEDQAVLAQPCVVAVDSGSGMRPRKDEYNNAAVLLETFLEVAVPELPPRSCIVVVNQVRKRKSAEKGTFYTQGTDSTQRWKVGVFSARLELSRTDVQDEDFTLVVNTVANQDGPPSTILTFPFNKKTGIDTMLDLVRLASELGVLVRSGSWYSVDGEDVQLGQGEYEAARKLGCLSAVARRVLERVIARS